MTRSKGSHAGIGGKGRLGREVRVRSIRISQKTGVFAQSEIQGPD